MDKSNSVAITKIEKLYQAAMNDRDSLRSFVGSEVLEDIYREQYFRAYRITHDVAQFAWETRQYRKFLRTHQPSEEFKLAQGPTSDPSGKGAREFAEEIVADVFPSMDTNNALRYVQQVKVRIEQFAASLRQQLSDRTDEKDFLERELGNFRRNAAHRAEQIAEEKLAPLTSQVSVLTKERDELKGRK